MAPENRTPVKHKLLALGIGVVLTLAATSCASGSEESDGPKVVVGGSDVGIAALMVPALKRAGDELGVEVEYKPMAQKTAQIALTNGDVDMGFMSITNLASAQEQGHDVIGLAPTWAANTSLVVKEDSPYKTAEDLKGKAVGSLNRTVSVYAESYFVLADMGIDMEKDYQLMLADSGGLLQGLLDSGQMEAITQYEPNTTRMLNQGGYRELFHTSTYWQDQGRPLVPSQNWAVRKEWLQQNDQDLMLRLTERATEIVKTDSSVYETNAAAVNLPTPDGTQLLFERFAPLLLLGYTTENLLYAQEELDQGKELGLLKDSHNISDLVFHEGEERK
jgi:ABC-type nitrate/sulfonate/bicarbonate transport system substrate-binding protein